ncbi:putative prophage endo-N-neuraminidase [Klebsiella pneumoniae]|nr:putative prophage endo-N-neuraminidase [Klebsiella pneumoniae]
MSNIKETPVWSDGVHLLARQERVEGGAGGSANIQAQQLANRTAYLKEALESIPDYRQHTFYPSEGDPDGTIAGVAGTEDGDGFRVALFDAAGVTAAYNIYRNVSGAAQFITAEPNTRYIELISQRIPVSVRGRFYAAILGMMARCVWGAVSLTEKQKFLTGP